VSSDAPLDRRRSSPSAGGRATVLSPDRAVSGCLGTSVSAHATKRNKKNRNKAKKQRNERPALRSGKRLSPSGSEFFSSFFFDVFHFFFFRAKEREKFLFSKAFFFSLFLSRENSRKRSTPRRWLFSTRAAIDEVEERPCLSFREEKRNSTERVGLDSVFSVSLCQESGICSSFFDHFYRSHWSSFCVMGKVRSRESSRGKRKYKDERDKEKESRKKSNFVDARFIALCRRRSRLWSKKSVQSVRSVPFFFSLTRPDDALSTPETNKKIHLSANQGRRQEERRPAPWRASDHTLLRQGPFFDDDERCRCRCFEEEDRQWCRRKGVGSSSRAALRCQPKREEESSHCSARDLCSSRIPSARQEEKGIAGASASFLVSSSHRPRSSRRRRRNR